MIPIAFDEANDILDKPADMTRDECEPLQICRASFDGSTPVIVSCWKLTKEEFEELQRTGRVYLIIWGHGMPPASIVARNPIRGSGNG